MHSKSIIKKFNELQEKSRLKEAQEMIKYQKKMFKQYKSASMSQSNLELKEFMKFQKQMERDLNVKSALREGKLVLTKKLLQKLNKHPTISVPKIRQNATKAQASDLETQISQSPIRLAPKQNNPLISI